MTALVKPLFRPEALRPRLAAFQPPPAAAGGHRQPSTRNTPSR